LTVSGGAIREPKNVKVLIGTKVSDLIEFCGGFAARPERLINGGRMMGQPLPKRGPTVPVWSKGTSGILALTAAEINDRPTSACIRCG